MRKLILILSISLIVIGEDIFAQQDSIWTLEKCIEHALNNNIQVRKSELSNQQYMIYSEQAKAQRFPSAFASINQNFNWSKSTATGESGLTGSNGSNYSVNSGVTIFNASRLTTLIKQADLSIEEANIHLRLQKNRSA
jgi:outer membrane protein